MHNWNFQTVPHILFVLAFVFALAGLIIPWRNPAQPGSPGMPWWEISWLFFLGGMIAT
jgi:hypothetical protein